MYKGNKGPKPLKGIKSAPGARPHGMKSFYGATTTKKEYYIIHSTSE